MLSDPIYKRDSKGTLRVWQYEVDGCRWRTIAGLVQGKKVVTGWTVSPGNTLRSPSEQAAFEANAERNKKLAREYHTTSGAAQSEGAKFFKPMLAKKYEGNLSFPVYVQPKLDGIRCIISAEGMFSREGKPIVSCPHVMEAYRAIARETKRPELILDGELYNHDLKEDFNTIISLVRQSKPTAEDLEAAREKIQFHCYDVPSIDEHPFRVRWAWLAFLPEPEIDFENNVVTVDDVIVSVPTFRVNNQEQLDDWYATFLSLGYEGQIIRLDEKYQNKRSSALLKRKEFMDEEFALVDVATGVGNWSGYAKRAFCRAEDGTTFQAGIKGSQAFTKQLLRESGKYDRVTVRFFARSEYGVPRFPVAVAWHVRGEKRL